MPRRLPLRDPIGYELRHSRAQERVGLGAKCAGCGEERPEALIPGSDPMICAECTRKANGQSVMDLHHVAGRANDGLTIPVRVNDHRAELTPAMDDWPEDTRKNPDGAPLLADAARIRGFCDDVVNSMEKLLLKSAEDLESLHITLQRSLGKNYWIKTSSPRNSRRSSRRKRPRR